MVAAGEPPVPNVEKGAVRVSPCTTRTAAMGTPSSSAATWARVVSWPWPWGAWLVNTVTRAVGLQPGRGPLRREGRTRIDGP